MSEESAVHESQKAVTDANDIYGTLEFMQRCSNGNIVYAHDFLLIFGFLFH